MTKEDWLSYLKDTLDKKTAIHLAQMAVEHNSIKDLIDLCFYNVSEMAFRASWILEHTLKYLPKDMSSFLSYFLLVYAKQTNNSCRRHFTKILMYVSEKERRTLLSKYELGPIIETTFEWLIDPKVPVAVQANCLNILFNLKDRYDWVEEELKAQIVFLLKDGSAAIQSRGKKLIMQIK